MSRLRRIIAAGLAALIASLPARADQALIPVNDSTNISVGWTLANQNFTDLYGRVASLQAALNGKVGPTDFAALTSAMSGKASTADLAALTTVVAGKATPASVAAAVAGVTKASLGIGNVANLAPADLPASNAVIVLLAGKLASNGVGSALVVTPFGASRSSTLEELFGRSVSILDFMPRNTADITTAIGLAETALGAAGGTIRFPPLAGCYTQTAPRVLKPGIAYEGEGRQPSCITTNFQGDVWTIGGTALVENAAVRRLTFRSSIVRTYGAALAVTKAYNTVLDDVVCDQNDHICIDVRAAPGQFKTHVNRMFAPAAGYIGLRIGYGSTDEVNIPTEVYVDTPLISAHTGAGIQLVAGSGLIFTNPDLLQNDVNWLINPGAGQIVTALQSKDGFVDSATNFNLAIVPYGTGSDPATIGRVTDATWTGIWTATAGTSTGAANIVIQGTPDSVRSLAFVGPRVLNGGCHGIDIQGGYGIDISAPQIGQNSQKVAGTCDGIHVAAGVSHWSVTGGRSGPGTKFAGSWQRYGINVEDGAGDNITIVGVDLAGNVTGGLRNGATGANQTIITQGAPKVLGGSSVALGQPAPALSATTGFAYVAATAGTPTAAPAAMAGMPLTGMAPITVDTTNGKICAGIGSAWKCAVLQ